MTPGWGSPRPHPMVGRSITGREDPKNPVCGGWERHGVDATETPSHSAWGCHRDGGTSVPMPWWTGVLGAPQSMVSRDTRGWMAPRPHPAVHEDVTGVTPWQMGDSEPPYNGGVRWEGLGGSSPCGLGGQWVFWVTPRRGVH